MGPGWFENPEKIKKVTTSTLPYGGSYLSFSLAKEKLLSAESQPAEVEADIAEYLTSSGVGSFTASDISVVKIEVTSGRERGRSIWSLNVTVEIVHWHDLPPLYQPQIQLESGKIIKVVEKDIKKTFVDENFARIYAESIKSDKEKRLTLINDYIKKQKESDKNFYNAEYVGGVRLENKEVYIKVNVSRISIDIENLPKNKVVNVVEKEIRIYYSSSETEVRSYAESFNSLERDQGHGTRQSVIDTYIREQEESDKNFINAEYVQPFRFRFDFKNYWKDVYVKVNVSEIGDSPEEIQRKKDEKAAAEAAEMAERERKIWEEVAKREKEELEKLADEFPTLKTSELKEILDNTWTLNSARTEAQKLLNAQVTAAQEAQKKLEEEQKAAAEALAAAAAAAAAVAAAAAAEANKKLEEEQKAAAEAAEAEAKKKLEEAKNEQERIQAIKDAEEARKKLEAEQKAAAEALAAAAKKKLEEEQKAAEEAKKKLEEEQKAAAIAAAKKKIEDEKLKYGSETWNVVILGKHVNTKSVIDYEQLQTIKISPTTTFYDIIKNNIVWFNVESVRYLIWSISNDDTPYGATVSASSSIYSQRTRFHVTGNNKLSMHEPLDGYGRTEEESSRWATRKDFMPSAKTTRIVDVCWDNVRDEMKCENKTVYIQMIYNKPELNQSIGKELMTPVIGIPIYTFTTFPDGKWFKIKYNQANKTYSFKKILQTPSLMRGIQSVEPDMLYKRKFYDDGIYRIKGSKLNIDPPPAKVDTYDLSEFIIKIIKDKYVMYTKDDKLISGMRSGTSPPNENAWPSDLILNPVVIPKDKVNKTDYENAKFGLIGAMPFLHNFSNNGEIVPNKKYYSPNKKYYAIFIPNDGLYTKDAESDKYKVRIRTPNSTSTILYSSQMASGGSQLHSLIFYKENETVKANPDLFADWTFRQRIDTEKAISLDTNKRRSFALVVTDLGELLCLDLYEGKIINKFEDYSKDVYGRDLIVRVNEPTIDPYQEQYNQDYKGIHDFNPQIQKQLPKPIPCSIFLPKNNEDKYLTFEYGKGGKVTDKRSESTQLFIKQAENLTEKYPNSYEVQRVLGSTFSSDTKDKKRGKEVLEVISPYSGTNAHELSMTHCRTSDRGGCHTLTESQIKQSIPKYECLDLPTIPREDWDVTYMDGNN